MSRTFKLEWDPYGSNDKIYSGKNVTFEPGITVLVGCNGSGKTTMLDCIITPNLTKLKIPFFTYSNIKSGGKDAISRSAFNEDFYKTALLMQSSEGEQIYYNISDIAKAIGKFVRDHKDDKELWFLFDGIDSGLSIDYIREINDDLFKTVINANSDKDIYIVLSANNYESTIGNMTMDTRTGKYVTIKSYDYFHKFIMRSRSLKDKRYGHDKEENA